MTAIFSLLIAVWILGWGMQDAGIVLQTVPPTVVFFAVLGLAAGQLSPAASSARANRRLTMKLPVEAQG